MATAVNFKLNADASNFKINISQVVKELLGLRKATDKSGAGAKKMSSDFSASSSKLNKFGGFVAGTIGKISELTASFSKLQIIGAAAIAGLAAGKGAQSATKSFASFEEGLLKIRAVTSATAGEMKEITGLIEKLGFETQFTTADIQKAVFNLGTLGVKGPAAFKKLLPSVVNAAVALDVDLSTAAEKVLSTMKVFNIEMDGSASVVDKLVGLYTNSAVNLEKWAIASQFAGLAAKTFNRSMDDLMPLIAALVDQGVDASIAGTQIRTAFLRLLKPTGGMITSMKEAGLTIEDLSVESLGFIGVLQKLEKANISNAQAMGIFGVRAAPIIKALLKVKREGKTGTAVLLDYQKAINKVGIGAQQAADRQQGLGFAMKQTSAALGIFSVTAGDAINKMFGLESIAKATSVQIGRITKFLKTIDFSVLSSAGIKIFDSGQIINSLFDVIGKVMPAFLTLLVQGTINAAITLIQVIIAGLPSIVKVLAKLVIGLVLEGGRLMAKAIFAAFKLGARLIGSVLFETIRLLGAAIGKIPGLEVAGASVEAAAQSATGDLALMIATTNKNIDAVFDIFRATAFDFADALEDVLQPKVFKEVAFSLGLLKEAFMSGSADIKSTIRDLKRGLGIKPTQTGFVKPNVGAQEVQNKINKSNQKAATASAAFQAEQKTKQAKRDRDQQLLQDSEFSLIADRKRIVDERNAFISQSPFIPSGSAVSGIGIGTGSRLQDSRARPQFSEGGGAGVGVSGAGAGGVGFGTNPIIQDNRGQTITNFSAKNRKEQLTQKTQRNRQGEKIQS